MKKTRTIAACVLALALASGGWLSCSGKQVAHDKPDAAAGTGGNGTGGASGGGASATGGAGGSGGSAGGYAWGAAPDWESTNMVVTSCAIEQLVNASQVRFFGWEPCSWSPTDCEQAVFNPGLVGNDPDFVGRVSSVHDDGTTVRVGLKFESPDHQGLFATQDGMGLAGIRPAIASGCYLGGASVHGTRFGVEMWHEIPHSATQFGGVVGDLAGGAQPVGFTLANPPPGGGAQGYALGTTRWLWWWAVKGYSTVSATDGSGYTEFVNMQSPGNFLDFAPPTTTGKHFLFDAFVSDDAGMAHDKIFYSDGIAPPQIYLKPTEPDTYYGSPIYADSYVAFFKGIGFQDVGLYNAVELWASPYSDDPSLLKPVKVGDVPDPGMPSEPAGGWGYVAFETSAGLSKWDVMIWKLADGTHRTFSLADGYNLMAFLGVSRQYAWVSASKLGGLQPYLLRIRLP